MKPVRVIVNDKMQNGYVYLRSRLMGRDFRPGFKPQLTPKQMLKLGKKFALTAWNEPAYKQEGDFKNVKSGNGYVLTCTAFDSKTFAKFRDKHRNKGGERYPSVQDMAPGA